MPVSRPVGVFSFHLNLPQHETLFLLINNLLVSVSLLHWQLNQKLHHVNIYRLPLPAKFMTKTVLDRLIEIET